MKIKSYKDLQNMPTMVRILDSTFSSDEEKMIGGEYEVRTEHHLNNIFTVWNKDKSDYYYFNKSDLQELTPIEHNGYRIGIGDWVECDDEWFEVYGYHWWNDQFFLNIARVIDSKPDYSSCWSRIQRNIHEVKPLYKEIDDETQQKIEDLKKLGYKITKE